MTDPEVTAAAQLAQGRARAAEDTLATGGNAVEVGACDLCGQELLRSINDCWHPWNVGTACPPEPPSGTTAWIDWYQAGNRTGRPGPEHWRAVR